MQHIYSIISDTLSAKADLTKLSDEIVASSIAPGLDFISTDGDVLEINFTSALSAGDVSTLAALVGAHDGVPYPVVKSPTDVHIVDTDSDTQGIKVTTKYAPDGFYQRLHEIEFTTSAIGGAIHDKDINNIDTGWSSCSFYKDVAGVETAWTPADQADLDLNCIRTDYHFMPSLDYMIKSAVMSHQELIDVATNGEIYMWGKMLDVNPALNGFGIFPIEVLGGGMAMSFVNARVPVGLKGVNGSMLYYGGVMNNGTFIPTGDGMGTNRITFVMRHNEGVKHRFQAIFEIFRAEL